jgi:hypothetical protein
MNARAKAVCALRRVHSGVPRKIFELRPAPNPVSLKFMRLSAAILLLTVSLFAAPAPWTPASFRGLTVGRAHREDALRALGTPDAAKPEQSGEELTYKARGDHKGDLSIRLDRAGMVTEIQEALPVAIPRTQIYREFGKDALTVHFSRAKCAADVLYRDPRGAIELTLYPTRGIALWPDQYGYDFAAILYLARPPGLPRMPVCASKH